MTVPLSDAAAGARLRRAAAGQRARRHRLDRHRARIDLLTRAPERYRVEALVAHRDAGEAGGGGARPLAPASPWWPTPPPIRTSPRRSPARGIEAAAGPDAVIEAAQRPADWVMAAIVGTAGLAPSLAALAPGRRLALANKECLVTAGALFMRRAAEVGATVLPVDSEHNAVFQGLTAGPRAAVEKVTLTASGGPFRTWTQAAIAAATPEQALKHPNWSMGAKITINSATLMNKGLELIEAMHLFQLDAGQLDVLVHPQSIVHALVHYSRRRGAGAAVGARHAGADRPLPGLAGAARRAGDPARPRRHRQPDLRAAGPRPLPGACESPWRFWPPAARRRPC